MTSTCANPWAVFGECRSIRLAVERQPVGKNLRVPAAKSLDAHVGRTERGGRHLHAHPLVSVSIIETSPGRHEDLLVDLSCGTTSTRIGSSSTRRPVRVDATTTTSSSTVGCRSS